MKNSSDTYLQNGQTVAEIKKLREQLSKDPTAVLSVCRNTETHEQRVGQFTKWMGERLSEIIRDLQQLEGSIRTCVEKLPAQSGFFVDAETRKKATLCVSYFLSEAERTVGGLRERGLSLSHFEERLKQEKHRCFADERRCELMLHAATELKDVCDPAPCREAFDSLKACGERYGALLEKERKAATLLRCFCQTTVVNFNARVEKNADLANGGERCEIRPMRAVLGELLYVCQGLQKNFSALK